MISLRSSCTLYPACKRGLSRFIDLDGHVRFKKKKKKGEKVRVSKRKPRESIKNYLCYLINLLQQIIHAKLGLVKSPKNNIILVRF